MDNNKTMKIIQGGILVLLVAVASLLYGIWRQKTGPAAPTEQSTTPVTSTQTTQQPSEEGKGAVVPNSIATEELNKPEIQSESKPTTPDKAAHAKAQKPVVPNAKAFDVEPAAPQPTAPPPAEAAAAPPAPVEKAPEVPPPPPRQVTIASGTPIMVRLLTTLASDKNKEGDPFEAELDDPIFMDGLLVADKGAHIKGTVLEVQQAGKVSGVAEIYLGLTRLQTVRGEVEIATERYMQKGDTSKKRDAAKVGAMAGIGTIIGAIAGGGKGAAIGAAAGGGAGAGTVLMTRGKAVQLERETKLAFHLKEPFTVTIQNQTESPAKPRQKLERF